MISVIIPLYNKSATVKQTIKTVLDQTISDYEIIVVDDGSTDNGIELIKEINNPQIRVIEQENRGVSSARNHGIQEARGEWIAFLDADDEWAPTHLESLVSLSKKYPQCDITACAYQFSNLYGNVKDIILNGVPNSEDFILDSYFYVATISSPPIHSSSVMVRKSALQTIGGFPEGVHQGEDLLTWARLAANGKIAYSLKPQSIFHTGVTSSMGIPKRIPAADDPVGKGLEEIYNQHPETTGLKQYIAHWHKMRASIYLRLPDCSRQCRNEIRSARHWYRNKRLVFYQILSYIPYRFRMNIINHI